MYKSIATSTCLALILLNSSIAKEPIDTSITKELDALIAQEPDLARDKLRITTKDRVIVLNGTVDTRLQADKVVELANSIDNVKDVDTYNLKVTDSKQYVKDALITSAVKGKIMLLAKNNKIEKTDIHVETTNGNVHLFGRLDNEEDLSVIRREVGRIKGVKSVNCNLEAIN